MIDILNPYFPLQPGSGGGGGGGKGGAYDISAVYNDDGSQDITITGVTTVAKQDKTVSIAKNGTYVINADEGYDCLSSVTANVNVSASPVSEGDVTFIDFDGTAFHSYTEDEIMGMDSLPEAPDHSGDDIPLTFDGWNWTLAQIKEQLNAVGAPVWVGANYHTTDGKTHVIVEQKEDGTDSWGAGIRVPFSSDITIDWGDGNTETPSSSTVYHTYSNAGVYDIKIEGASYVGLDATTYQAMQCAKIIAVRYSSYITSIGTNSFRNNCSLRSISIPSSVTTIGSKAFDSCTLLQSATIPSSATSIGSEAFFDCCSLQSVTIPDSVTTIGNKAFSGCSSLKGITIPSSVTSIGIEAFINCYSLQSVTIPDSVTTIGNKAFSGCSSLKGITIPSSVTSIDSSTFSNCYSLQSISIPSSVTSIGTYAFSGCRSLQSATIPSSVISIGTDAFSGCYSLQSVTIPEGVTSIGKNMFSNCSSLKNISIPEGVTSIGTYAVNGCRSLQSVTIPEGVTSIGTYAFSYCYSLYTVRLKPTVPPELASSNAFNTSYQQRIVVPKGSLEAYKSATNWSAFASIIVEEE